MRKEQIKHEALPFCVFFLDLFFVTASVFCCISGMYSFIQSEATSGRHVGIVFGHKTCAMGTCASFCFTCCYFYGKSAILMRIYIMYIVTIFVEKFHPVFFLEIKMFVY
jgi:hypothetical protein